MTPSSSPSRWIASAGRPFNMMGAAVREPPTLRSPAPNKCATFSAPTIGRGTARFTPPPSAISTSSSAKIGWANAYPDGFGPDSHLNQQIRLGDFRYYSDYEAFPIDCAVETGFGVLKVGYLSGIRAVDNLTQTSTVMRLTFTTLVLQAIVWANK